MKYIDELAKENIRLQNNLKHLQKEEEIVYSEKQILEKSNSEIKKESKRVINRLESLHIKKAKAEGEIEFLEKELNEINNIQSKISKINNKVIWLENEKRNAIKDIAENERIIKKLKGEMK